MGGAGYGRGNVYDCPSHPCLPNPELNVPVCPAVCAVGVSYLFWRDLEAGALGWRSLEDLFLFGSSLGTSPSSVFLLRTCPSAELQWTRRATLPVPGMQWQQKDILNGLPLIEGWTSKQELYHFMTVLEKGQG